MKTSFSRKQLGLAAACALALGIMAGTASADTMAPADQRAVVSGPSGMAWMDGSGNCLRSDFGPPPLPNTPCGPQQVAEIVVPAPVAQAAPPPAPVAAPQPVVEKVSLSADTLFDFDKAILRPQGRDALDAFVGKLQGVEVGTITAVGHTDRIGSSEYNQKLSDERAAAVKDYLVSKGLNSAQVQTEGVGETQPVTEAGECARDKSKSVIECLQPDRRVEIEVSGTRTTQ